MTKEWERRVHLWLDTLAKRLYRPMADMTFEYFTTKEHLSCEEAQKGDFRPIGAGEAWGSQWEYGWFRAALRMGDWAKGERIVMDLRELAGEATLFVNGEVYGTKRADWVEDTNHYLCDNWLTKASDGTEVFELLAECYAGHQLPDEVDHAVAGPVPKGYRWERDMSRKATLGKCTFGVWDEEAWHLLLELRNLQGILQNADPDALRTAEVEEALEQATMILDFSLDAEGWKQSVRDCRAYLKPYLECRNGSTAPMLHAVGHAHIDLCWKWPYEETERKCARTMAAQLRHMDEYPEYRMLLSQPQLFELIEQHYPALFEKLKGKIANGQLIPEGGMWVESDTNVPSGESLIRQFLYGRRYFREKLGVESRMLWLPDVFGYSAALPQIMAGCGIEAFATAKIFWAYNGGEQFPYQYFDWKGLDGTSIRSFLYSEYCSRTDAGFLIREWRGRRERKGLGRLMTAIGYGDGGGGPTRDHIEYARLNRDCEGVPRIQFDHPMHLMDTLQTEKSTVPEYVGELYFQAHRGTYTSQARTKRGNRRCELALRDAELWSALACGAETYPREALERAWKLVLKNQFHDILPGSSIAAVYERAEREHAEVQAFAADVSGKMRASLTEGADGITVFNSLSWPRRAIIPLPEGWQGAKTADGTLLPVQTMAGSTWAEADVPALGTLSLYRSECTEAEGTMLAGNTLENAWLKLTLNDRGEIISLIDKETGTEWAAGVMNELRLYQDIPTRYEAWDIDSMRKPVPIPDGKAEVTVTENGPLVCELKVQKPLCDSHVTQWIRMERGSGVVTFRTKVDWQESQKLLKAAFPVNITTDKLVSEIQFGHVERPNHGSRQYDKDRFEVCNHRWSALAEAGRGFALLNDCKYGIGCQGGTMELTLLKSALWPDEAADKGTQEFTYALMLWNTPLCESGVVQRAYELNVPPTVAAGTRADGSFLAVEDENVVVDTVKRAEDGNGLIIRLYEASGSRRKTALHVNLPMTRASAVSMTEETEKQALPVSDGIIPLTLSAFEVLTLRIS